MNNKRFTRIGENLAKLAKLDTQHEIFGSSKHRYELNTPKTKEQLEKFEEQYDIALPQEYKNFLLHVGNGGAGPFYGLYSLEKGIEEAESYSTQENTSIKNAFATEFPINNAETKKFIDHHNACLEEGDDDEIKYLDVPDPFTGVIFLAEYGCGWSYVLVVRGEQAGKVWFMGDYLSPVFIGDTQWGFLDWYEDWLNKSLQKFDPRTKTEPLKQSTTIVNYDGWKLKEIPKEVFESKNLKKLVFSRNDLPEFPKEILKLTNLRTLDLSMTPIIDIPEEISVLKDLKKLRLNYNYHLTLPDSLEQLKNLEEISMYYNYKLSEIPEVVGSIASLKRLYFQYCGALKKIPGNIGNLKNLQTFQFNDCTSLEVLPESFVELTNLRSLNMSKTKIKKLPQGFENLRNLEFLAIDIEDLDLEDALEKLKKLPKLVYLKISHQLQYPESFRELKSLKTLVISQNYTLANQGHKTVAVPEQVTYIPHLEILDLMNNNQAQSLPENIGNMTHLKELNLSATRVKEFPESLKKLPHLEKIEGSLEDNPTTPFGIRPAEKGKVISWFPKAKIWIY